MVKRENFKTCAQSGFCMRNRAYADTAASSSIWEAPYNLDSSSIEFSNGQLTGTVLKTTIDGFVILPLTVTFLESGSARVTLDEEKRRKGEIELRHGSKAQKKRYDEAAKHVIVGDVSGSKGAALSRDTEDGSTRVHYGPAGKFEAVIKHAPMSIEFRRDGEAHVVLNGRGLLNMEHWRPKVEKEVKEGEEGKEEENVAVVENAEDESTWWDESFGGATDSKPKGPESVALDITFPGYDHVYGIPEHASSLSLKETR